MIIEPKNNKIQGPDPDKLIELIKAVTDLHKSRGKNSASSGKRIDQAIEDLMGSVSLYCKMIVLVKND